MACHGTDERPLQLYAEQRFRLEVSWDDFDTPLSNEELMANFRLVGGFIARDDGERDLLTEKPLDTRSGGLFHGGKGLHGEQDVFLSRHDVGYRLLREFSGGGIASPDCVAIEEVGQ